MKPKILISTSTFPRFPNDPQTAPFVWDLARSLTSKYQVFLLAPHVKDTPFTETWEEIRITRFPYFPAGQESLVEPGGILPNLGNRPLKKLQLPPFFLSQIFHLVKLIRQEKISIVNSHWLVPQGLSGAIVNRLINVPHITTVHAADLYWLKRQKFGPALAKFIVSGTQKVVCVSRKNKEVLDSLLSKSSNAAIIPMGVDTNLFTLPTKTTKRSGFLFVGKLVKKKGVAILIDAWQKLAQKETPPQLTIIGDGPPREDLVTKVKDNNLDKFIKFLDPLPHPKLVKYYQKTKGLVVPSIIDPQGQTEGLPVVILEALACGTPVIAADVGGISEVVTLETGRLLPNATPADLARVTGSFNPHQFSQARIRQRALNYSWEQIARSYHQIFVQLTKDIRR